MPALSTPPAGNDSTVTVEVNLTLSCRVQPRRCLELPHLVGDTSGKGTAKRQQGDIVTTGRQADER